MEPSDYPPLKVSSDKASRRAQVFYLSFFGLQLALFALVSIAGAFSRLISDTDRQKALFLWVAIFLALGIVVSLVVRDRKFDKVWFDGRAVAESAKTLSWRFMMQSEPLGKACSEVDLITELDRVRTWRPGLSEQIVTGGSSATERMRTVRAAEWKERRAFYAAFRAREQQHWYTRNAQRNRTYKETWYWSILVLQLGACGFALAASRVGPPAVNATGILMTLSASAAAWNLARRHEELSNSYSLAADELAKIYDLIRLASTENEFLKLVDQGEEAISREHTMWCARRNILLLGARKG